MNDKKMSQTGIIILIVIFGIFYMVTTFFLDRKVANNQVEVPPMNENVENELSNTEYIHIINNLYSDLRILYDVVNNKFKVDQNDTLVVGEITYKKVTNFYEVMDKIFTEKGTEKYLKDLDNYFAVTSDGIYLAGNLVTYQTYYFRGDDTNIYVIDHTEHSVKAIIYERWTSNETNTLSTIDLVKVNNDWLVDDVTILSNK